MKKLYALPGSVHKWKLGFLLLFLSLTTAAFSQRKSEFGLVAKTGNYTLPIQKTVRDGFYGSAYGTSQQNAGGQYTLGIWYAFPFSSHFRLSAELLYNAALFTQKDHFQLYDWEGINYSDQIQRISENSLSLPVKLHYFFKKGGKSSIVLGGGLSRTFSTKIFTEVRSQFSPGPEVHSAYTLAFSDWENFEYRLNFSAGFHYQLDPKTSIGLEYTFQKSAEIYQQYPNVFLNPLIDCLCLFIEPETRPNMHSFSVSLRHNLLH